jgi:hypothetical protein
MAQSFSAQIQEWARKVQGATESVFKESAQEVVAEMQKPRGEGGRMRVDTGFLRASLMASTAALPNINPGNRPVPGQSYPYNAGPIEAVIAGSDLGDTIYFGYTAAYAGHREFGARGQAPDAFVRTAAQRWQAIVDAKTNELRNRLGL